MPLEDEAEEERALGDDSSRASEGQIEDWQGWGTDDEYGKCNEYVLASGVVRFEPIHECRTWRFQVHPP